MQRMGGLDSAFLYFETPTMHMHVGGLMLVDPSEAKEPYSFENYRAYIEARLPRVPSFRRKLATVPLNLGRPIWVEDPDFDLDYHLHRAVVPAPGGDRETAAVAADVLSRQMDRSHPLWEMWVLEGRADGLIGIVSKVHHSVIDGMTGANMMAELFDLEKDAVPAAPVVDDWEPERKPSDLEMVGRSLVDWAVRPARIVKLVPSTLMSVGKIANRRGRGGVPGMPAPFRAPRTSFNATITAQDDQERVRREDQRRRDGRVLWCAAYLSRRPGRAARALADLCDPDLGARSRRRHVGYDEDLDHVREPRERRR
jgi:WS/DGAT/MGAT family acyltransferase